MKRLAGLTLILALACLSCASNSKVARIKAVRELKDPAAQAESYTDLASNFELNQKEQMALIKTVFKSRLDSDSKARVLTNLARQQYFSQKSLVYLVKRLPKLKTTSEPVQRDLMEAILTPPVE